MQTTVTQKKQRVYTNDIQFVHIFEERYGTS